MADRRDWVWEEAPPGRGHPQDRPDDDDGLDKTSSEEETFRDPENLSDTEWWPLGQMRDDKGRDYHVRWRHTPDGRLEAQAIDPTVDRSAITDKYSDDYRSPQDAAGDDHEAVIRWHPYDGEIAWRGAAKSHSGGFVSMHLKHHLEDWLPDGIQRPVHSTNLSDQGRASLRKWMDLHGDHTGEIRRALGGEYYDDEDEDHNYDNDYGQEEPEPGVSWTDRQNLTRHGFEEDGVGNWEKSFLDPHGDRIETHSISPDGQLDVYQHDPQTGRQYRDRAAGQDWGTVDEAINRSRHGFAERMLPLQGWTPHYYDGGRNDQASPGYRMHGDNPFKWTKTTEAPSGLGAPYEHTITLPTTGDAFHLHTERPGGGYEFPLFTSNDLTGDILHQAERRSRGDHEGGVRDDWTRNGWEPLKLFSKAEDRRFVGDWFSRLPEDRRHVGDWFTATATTTTAAANWWEDENAPPVRVFRIENGEGEGPYQAGSVPELNHMYDAHCYNEGLIDHPTPEKDGIKVSVGGKLHGFESMDSLNRWFDGYHKDLHDAGFGVAEYKVDPAKVWVGGHQVAFDPNYAHQERWTTFPALAKRQAAINPIKPHLPFADLEGLGPQQSAFQRTHPKIREKVLNQLLQRGNLSAYKALLPIHQIQTEHDSVRAAQGRPSPYAHPRAPQPWQNPLETTLELPLVEAAAHRYVLPEDYYRHLGEDERQAKYLEETEGDPHDHYSYTGVDPAWGESGPHPGYTDEQATAILSWSGPFYHGSEIPDLTSIDWRNGKANSSTGDSGYRNFFTNDTNMARNYGRYIYEVEPSNWEDVEPDPHGGRFGWYDGHPSLGHAAEAAENGGVVSMQAYHPLNVVGVHDTESGEPMEHTAAADPNDDQEDAERRERARWEDLFDNVGEDYLEKRQREDAKERERLSQPEFPGAPWRKPYPNTAADIPGFGLSSHPGDTGWENWQVSKKRIKDLTPVKGEDAETINYELGVPRRSLSAVTPGDPQYGLGSGHTAPASGPTMDSPEDYLPDVYEHPEYYSGTGYREAHRALLRARGNPDAQVKIYRAVPHGITEIEGNTNPRGASWVSPSSTYAKFHAESQSCPACGGDMQVISGMARAGDLHNEGYLTEWGYAGDPIHDPTALTECPEGAYEARQAAEAEWMRRHSANADWLQGQTMDSIGDTLRARHPDIDFDVYPAPGKTHLKLQLIRVPDELQGQGRGTAAMNDLVAAADHLGTQVSLTPESPTGARNKGRLDRFYRSFGFRPNKGRNKDYTVWESYRRMPKLGAAANPEAGLKAAGIAVIAMDTGRVLMLQRALNPVMCPCGLPVTWDEQNGYQHDDGSVSHDGEFYGQSVSDLLDQGHDCPCCQGMGDDEQGHECVSCDGSGVDPSGVQCETPCRPESLDKTAALEHDPNEGAWEFPGGTLEDGEDPRTAAIREFREEVGQALPQGVFVGAWLSPGGLVVAAAAPTSAEPPQSDTYWLSTRGHDLGWRPSQTITNPPMYYRRAPSGLTHYMAWRPELGGWQGDVVDAGGLSTIVQPTKLPVFDSAIGAHHGLAVMHGEGLGVLQRERNKEHRIPESRQEYEPGNTVENAETPFTLGEDAMRRLNAADPAYQQAFHDWADREIGYSPEDIAALPLHEQGDLADAFGRYIGEDVHRDARYHLDLPGAGYQKVRTGRPGTMVRVLRVEKPDGSGPFEYGTGINPRPYEGRPDPMDLDHYRLLNPDLEDDPDAGSVRQLMPHADKIPARYARGRVFGFLPQHRVDNYFTPTMLQGLHDRGYGMSEYDVPGDSLVIGRTQAAWRPEDAVRVSHRPLVSGRVASTKPEWWEIHGDPAVPLENYYGEPSKVPYLTDDARDRDPGWYRTIDPDHRGHSNPSGDALIELKSVEHDHGPEFEVNHSYGMRPCENCWLRGEDELEAPLLYSPEHFEAYKHKPMEMPRYVASTGDPLADQDEDDELYGLPGHVAPTPMLAEASAEPWEPIPNYRGDLLAGMQDWNWEEFHNNTWLDGGYDHAKMTPQEAGRLRDANEAAMRAGTHDHYFHVNWALDKNGLVRTKKTDRAEDDAKTKAFWDREARRGYWDDGNVFHEYYDHRDEPCFNCGEVHDRPLTAEGSTTHPASETVHGFGGTDPLTGRARAACGQVNPGKITADDAGVTCLRCRVRRHTDGRIKHQAVAPIIPHPEEHERQLLASGWHQDPNESHQFAKTSPGTGVTHHLTWDDDNWLYHATVPDDNGLIDNRQINRDDPNSVYGRRPIADPAEANQVAKEYERAYVVGSPYGEPGIARQFNDRSTFADRYGDDERPWYEPDTAAVTQFSHPSRERRREGNPLGERGPEPDQFYGDFRVPAPGEPWVQGLHTDDVIHNPPHDNPWGGLEKLNAVAPVYKCFIYLIQHERDLDLTSGRDIDNPDDPDGDMTEQCAWWDIEDAKNNPALRPECKSTPWDELELWADKSVRASKEIKEALAKLAAQPPADIPNRAMIKAGPSPYEDEPLVQYGDKKFYRKVIPWATGNDNKENADKEYLGSLMRRSIGINAAHNVRSPRKDDDPYTIYSEMRPDVLPRYMLSNDDEYRKFINTKAAALTGLGDMLMVEGDRRRNNWERLPNGEPYVYDFAYSDPAPIKNLGPSQNRWGQVWSDFAHPYMDDYVSHHFGRLGDNPLAPSDVSRITQALHSIRPEYERAGRSDWHDELLDRWNEIAGHATGSDEDALLAGKTLPHEMARKLGMGLTDRDYDSLAFPEHDSNAVYLRFGHWPANERSMNYITGFPEEGVSAYELNKKGKPVDPDSAMNRGQHEYDERDCGPLDEDGRCENHGMEDAEQDEDYTDDTAEMLRDHINDAMFQRNEHPSRMAHLVKGDFVGFGHDDEPLLHNVRLVGHWPCDTHKFIPGAPAGRASWCRHIDHEFPDDEEMEHEAATKADKCMYCQQPATKEIVHSEGMGRITCCDRHLEQGKDAAANCVPYGGPDKSNIDMVRDAGARPKLPDSLRYKDRADSPYTKIVDEGPEGRAETAFWRYIDPELGNAPDDNIPLTGGSGYGQNERHYRSTDQQPMMMVKPQTDYDDEDHFDRALAGGKTKVEWGEPICETCYLKGGLLRPRDQHDTLNTTDWVENAKAKPHEFKPMVPATDEHGMLREAWWKFA